MNYGLEAIVDQIDVFLLIMVRITAFFLITPIFGRRSIPNIFKIGFAMLIAIMIASTMDITIDKRYNNMISYTLLVFAEFMAGMILSYVTYLAFLALYMAGQIIDMQIGFGMVNVIDPQSNIQIPLTANFYNIIAILAFLAIDGHHLLVSAIYYSFNVLPLGGFNINDVVAGDIIRIFSESFALGFKIAAPIVVVIFIINLALGILARTVPQMNVFFVGLPLKIFVGLAMLALMFPLFSYIMDSLTDNMFKNIEFILRDMVQ